MASRAMLHKTKLEDFKYWLTENNVNWRLSDHAWQVLQIRAKTSRGYFGWIPIFENIHSDHLTVPQTLVALVSSFVRGQGTVSMDIEDNKRVYDGNGHLNPTVVEKRNKDGD